MTSVSSVSLQIPLRQSGFDYPHFKSGARSLTGNALYSNEVTNQNFRKRNLDCSADWACWNKTFFTPTPHKITCLSRWEEAEVKGPDKCLWRVVEVPAGKTAPPAPRLTLSLPVHWCGLLRISSGGNMPPQSPVWGNTDINRQINAILITIQRYFVVILFLIFVLRCLKEGEPWQMRSLPETTFQVWRWIRWRRRPVASRRRWRARLWTERWITMKQEDNILFL